MTIIVRDGTNTARTITEIQVRDGTNTPRDVTEVWVRDSNNVRRKVFGETALSVNADPLTVAGYGFAGVVDTDYTLAAASGGTPPYTYLWSIIEYTNATPPTIGFPSAATTYFEQTNVVSYDSAVFRCTAIDDNGATATVDVDAVFQTVAP